MTHKKTSWQEIYHGNGIIKSSEVGRLDLLQFLKDELLNLGDDKQKLCDKYLTWVCVPTVDILKKKAYAIFVEKHGIPLPEKTYTAVLNYLPNNKSAKMEIKPLPLILLPTFFCDSKIDKTMKNPFDVPLREGVNIPLFDPRYVLHEMIEKEKKQLKRTSQDDQVEKPKSPKQSKLEVTKKRNPEEKSKKQLSSSSEKKSSVTPDEIDSTWKVDKDNIKDAGFETFFEDNYTKSKDLQEFKFSDYAYANIQFIIKNENALGCLTPLAVPVIDEPDRSPKDINTNRKAETLETIPSIPQSLPKPKEVKTLDPVGKTKKIDKGGKQTTLIVQKRENTNPEPDKDLKKFKNEAKPTTRPLPPQVEEDDDSSCSSITDLAAQIETTVDTQENIHNQEMAMDKVPKDERKEIASVNDVHTVNLSRLWRLLDEERRKARLGNNSIFLDTSKYLFTRKEKSTGLDAVRNVHLDEEIFANLRSNIDKPDILVEVLAIIAATYNNFFGKSAEDIRKKTLDTPREGRVEFNYLSTQIFCVSRRWLGISKASDKFLLETQAEGISTSTAVSFQRLVNEITKELFAFETGTSYLSLCNVRYTVLLATFDHMFPLPTVASSVSKFTKFW